MSLSRSIASSYNGLACLKVGNKIRYKYLDYKCCMGDPIENGVSKEFSSSISYTKIRLSAIIDTMSGEWFAIAI